MEVSGRENKGARVKALGRLLASSKPGLWHETESGSAAASGCFGLDRHSQAIWAHAELWLEQRAQKRDGRTAHEINPAPDRHLFASLHHLECLVEEDFASECIIDNLYEAVRERKSPATGVLYHGNSAAKGKLDNDAAA